MEGILRIIAAGLSVSAFASLLGISLAVAAKRLHVETDKDVEEISNLLPGLNCGICGFAGCESYAKALSSPVENSEEDSPDVTLCSPGGMKTRESLSEKLGLEHDAGYVRKVARLACLGADGVALKEFSYKGYSDCESVVLHFGGDKGCKYGCLGRGSCVKVCPVDAIETLTNGLVRVDEEACISCGKCAAVCPTGVMKMVPAETPWFVACNSRDSAKVTKSLCSAGCIGCKICEKKFPDAGFFVQDNLSEMNYNETLGNTAASAASAASACPPKCIVKVGNDA